MQPKLSHGPLFPGGAFVPGGAIESAHLMQPFKQSGTRSRLNILDSFEHGYRSGNIFPQTTTSLLGQVNVSLRGRGKGANPNPVVPPQSSGQGVEDLSQSSPNGRLGRAECIDAAQVIW